MSRDIAREAEEIVEKLLSSVKIRKGGTPTIDRLQNKEISELLNDFKELGVRVVLFLETFHVAGVVKDVGKHLVVLTKCDGEDVEVESNHKGHDLENPNRIWVTIDEILAVSVDHDA